MGREPPGFQRAPQLRTIVVCGIAALVLAVVAVVLDFRLDNDLSSPDQAPDGPAAAVVRPDAGLGAALNDPLRIRATHDPARDPATDPR